MSKPLLKLTIPFSPKSQRNAITPVTAPRLSLTDSSALFRFSIKSPTYRIHHPQPSFLNSPGHKNSGFNLVLQSVDEPEDLESSAIRSRAQKMKKVNLDELSQEQLLELAITILHKAPEFRNNQDIRMLERTTKNVEFFQKYDKDTHEQICRYMTYVSCPQGQTVFDIGSHGDTFYIIMKGSVDVWVYLPHVVEETKPDGTVESITEMALTNVRTLLAGNSFGELALMENKPRAATIICSKKCYFGVLDKSSFDNILKEKEKRKLYEKIDFFASMKLFGKWSFNAVKLLYYQTDSLDCIRNQQVLKEGQESMGIYLIKSGEFKLMAKILISFSEEEQEQYALSRGILHNYYKTIELCVLNIGEVIGEEEIVFGIPQQLSAYCASNKGSLFFLNKKEFYRRVWSDENSRTFLQKTIKSKKAWRELRIKEIIAMEKDKVFNKSSSKSSTFNPKKISTHLLYKRLSKISKDRDAIDNLNQKSVVLDVSQEDMITNSRISNKNAGEIDFYGGFKLQNVKKLELWEKFRQAKEKMNFSPRSFSKTTKGFLSKLTRGSQVPMKLMRDIGLFDGKSQLSLKKMKVSNSNSNKSQHTAREDHFDNIPPIDTSLNRTNYVKIQAFSAIKHDGQPEINNETLGHLKYYSEEQKIEAEKKLQTPYSSLFERKPTADQSSKPRNLNRTLGKFKKNILNIFVSTESMSSGKKRKNSEKSREAESFDFFNVSSKTIYAKLI